MLNNKAWLDDVQRNISDLIAKSPAADIERNVKAFMGQAFSRMDLVTREEFDIQAALLERALARISDLETKVQSMQMESARQRPEN
ncbi:accessory factor UbiK family protein [Pusillimonas sp. CC-YST705]|uniref:Ubiquinone biosynthesis accessory factor UbiK n=1 Tax=Mesopusillimonas faecipullorum TaxID=2755040 RepID=A0ABS8CBF4_9BURK|nr:accessory factor UbiK family protein [Mesopusillimonas faecipullorum]MCB5363348.1 accessory factor UbiK family protein [Mesopusillimonas faecipullorum]